MKKTTLLLTFAILATVPALQAGSLRDYDHARALTTGEQALFGPKSARLRYDPRMIRAAQLARQRVALERGYGLHKPAPAPIAAN